MNSRKIHQLPTLKIVKSTIYEIIQFIPVLKDCGEDHDAEE